MCASLVPGLRAFVACNTSLAASTSLKSLRTRLRRPVGGGGGGGAGGFEGVHSDSLLGLQEDFKHRLTVHFNFLPFKNGSTSLDATKNHHCPGFSNAGLFMEISAERA